MADILFVPLNTNHVGIFEPVFGHLRSSWAVVSHDRVAESQVYRTGPLLRDKGVEPVEFPERVARSGGGLCARVGEARRIRRGVRRVLDETRPRVVVLGIDHDPIAVMFIREARRRGARTVVLQEGLIRPGDMEENADLMGSLTGAATASLGLPVRYGRFGRQGADAYLLSGSRARDILQRAGVPAGRLVVVGQPKYDRFIGQSGGQSATGNGTPALLFAAPADLLKAPWGPGLVRALAGEARRRELRIVVKLHPRGLLQPEEVLGCAGDAAGDFFTAIRTGDDTIELLRRSDGLITISSTVVLEALILGKECVVLDYLAGKSSLGYGASGAVHVVEAAPLLGERLAEAVTSPTSPGSKRRLLEEELHLLDGRAAERVAAYLEAA